MSSAIRARRLVGSLVAIAAAAMIVPIPVLGAGPTGRVVVQTHKAEYSEHVTDDVCGDVAGSLGLRAGWFHKVETGRLQILTFDDMFHLVDIETGTYSYDFDDPAIPDVTGHRYTSPTSIHFTKGETFVHTENIVEFVPGAPDGIRLSIRYHLTWRSGVPLVEREVFRVTGCP